MPSRSTAGHALRSALRPSASVSHPLSRAMESGRAALQSKPLYKIYGERALSVGHSLSPSPICHTHARHFLCVCPVRPPPPPELSPTHATPPSSFDTPESRFRLFAAIDSGRGTTRAEDAQGTPTQSHIPAGLLVYEDNRPRPGSASVGLAGYS